MRAGLCVVYVCACVQCGVGVPMGIWRPEVDFSHLLSLSTSALETGSLPDPGWHSCSWLASQWVPGIYLSPPLLLWKPGSLSDFLCGAKDTPQVLVLRRQFTDWDVSPEPLSPTLFVRLGFGDFHLQPGIFGAIDWKKAKGTANKENLLWKVIFCPASASGPVFMEACGNKTRVAAKWPLLIWATSTSLLNNKTWFL